MTRPGLLPRQAIRDLAARGHVGARDAFRETQFQPASLDLRLGPKAFRVRASFLPGRERTVAEQIDALNQDALALDEPGAVLERGCVYLVPLLETLALPPGVTAAANPKSSTGRLDIFTRLITDRSEIFDHVADGYAGPLYAEISPRSFSVRVRTGSALNQIRFRRLDAAGRDGAVDDAQLMARHAASRLVDGELTLRGGLILRVGLSGGALGPTVGYRAQKHANIIDIDRLAAYAAEDYWEALRARADRRLILDPGEFYILASRERMRVPPDLAAEMMPIDPAMGEFRVHYAGFFDPGFGHGPAGKPGSRAVLEVRSHDVPFILEDGQVIGRLVFEPMAAAPDRLYGEAGTSNYQGQALKLSKHFRVVPA